MHVGGIKASHTFKLAELAQAINTSFTSRVIPFDRKSSREIALSETVLRVVESEVGDTTTHSRAEAGLESSMYTWEVLEGFQASHLPVGLLTTPTPDLNARSVPLTEASARLLGNALCC